MFSPFKTLPFAQSRRATSALIVLSLCAVATAIYLSPAGGAANGSGKHPSTPSAAAGSPAPSAGGGSLAALGSAVPSATTGGGSGASSGTGSSPTQTAKPKPASSGHEVPAITYPGSSGGGYTDGSAGSGTSGYRVVHAAAKTDVVVVKEQLPGKTTTNVVQAASKIPSCSDFTWQQDAQAAYVANLSDPGALDGAKGPNNGDGIACNQLPPDPNRAKSIPVDPYVPPTVTAGTKAALVSPSTKYFGVAEDGLPGDTSMLSSIDKELGKAPNMIEYFQNLDDQFRPDLIQDAWKAGALPVITLQTQGTQSGRDYSLQAILDGDWDTYLKQYAISIMTTGLPFVLRLDHEMNGNWYPWSAGLPQNQGAPGQPNLYVQAWRYIWNFFQGYQDSDGMNANDYVIWAWTPDRIDGMTTSDTGKTCHSSSCQYQTSITQDYPGDGYVDWVGFSGYAWKPDSNGSTASWNPTSTYAATINALEKLTTKPIFIAETGAAKAYGGTPATSTTAATPGQDTTAAQASWIAQALPYIAGNSRIVGFSYFNNDSTGAHVIDGVQVETDWKLDDSPGALSAFKAGINSNVFGTGLVPDGV